MSSLPRIHSALSKDAVDFIDEKHLHDLIGRPSDPVQFEEILAKSLAKKPLTPEESAVLLNAADPEQHERLYATARQLKQDVYGNRIVLFAPLYVGNQCINDCAYCGFRRSNPDAVRRTLARGELIEQVRALEDVGHKRLILVFGEHPQYDAQFIAETVRTVYEVKSGHGEIRRVNINAAPLDHEGYRTVKSAGIGTYQVFQETYHHDTYRRVHPRNTLKGDYLWRLDALSRAWETGLDDVGIGALFGLYDWRFDTLALVRHAQYLMDRFDCGPHTISFPRLKKASGVALDEQWLVGDEEFKRLVAVLRLSVPYTGMILTARENPELRREIMGFGVSQIDAGSRIELGGYTEAGDATQQVLENEQFELGDVRSLDEVIRELVVDGYVPSFCTACYRLGRTGEEFMEFAIPGFIAKFCTPNACTTLMEYLVDYAKPETVAAIEERLADELAKIDNPRLREAVAKRMEKIRSSDARDLYF